MRRRVLICDRIAKEGIDLLEQKGYEVTRVWDKPKSYLSGIIDEYDAVIVRSATRIGIDIIDNARNLKVIGRAGIGLDNIDMAACQEHHVTVVNTPQASATSVAELAIAHLLALQRDIVKATITLREGRWMKEELEGTEVCGKILGIIGYGNIGRIVERMVLALGMEVAIVDEHVHDQTIPLEEMLPKADFISIHVPLTPQNRHLLSTREFEMMKDGVVIIDCSRGGVVDPEALYQAIVSGKVKAAALDVFENEPPGKHKLLTLENVHATPHLGAQTKEALQRTSVQIAEKVIEELEKLECA